MTTPPPAAQPAAPVAGAPINTLAIVSLVLSIVGLGTFVTAIAGVITGYVALGQIERTGQGGRSLARAGIVIGYIVSALGLALIVLGLAGVLFYYRYAT